MQAVLVCAAAVALMGRQFRESGPSGWDSTVGALWPSVVVTLMALPGLFTLYAPSTNYVYVVRAHIRRSRRGWFGSADSDSSAPQCRRRRVSDPTPSSSHRRCRRLSGIRLHSKGWGKSRS